MPPNGGISESSSSSNSNSSSSSSSTTVEGSNTNIGADPKNAALSLDQRNTTVELPTESSIQSQVGIGVPVNGFAPATLAADTLQGSANQGAAPVVLPVGSLSESADLGGALELGQQAAVRPSRLAAFSRPLVQPAAPQPKRRRVDDLVATDVRDLSAPGPHANATRAKCNDWIYLADLEIGLDPVKEDINDDELEQDQTDGDRAVVFRRSRYVALGGPHPDLLTEPRAIAKIALPPLQVNLGPLKIPRCVADDGLLSSPQMETVAYAIRRFRSNLPDGSRAGYYLGDGTGCGKGRMIAACLWHFWNEKERRHLWLSASADLLEDARRDFQDLGASLPLASLGSMSYGSIASKSKELTGLDQYGDGVLFATYHMLVASKSGARGLSGVGTPNNSRLAQIIEWLGGRSARGMVTFDEAHKAKNTGNFEAAGASKTGLAVLDLQRICPRLACLYASATGATEIKHLGYMERLGLHGPGRPHRDFEELKLAVEKGGLAAMELVAITMRSEGMLSCRALSFRGTSFNLRIMPLNPDQTTMYTLAAELWQRLMRVLFEMLIAEKARIKAQYGKKAISHQLDVSTTMRYFWSMQQQFFKQLLVSMKVEKAAQMVEDALVRGEQAVVAMWSTGESLADLGLTRVGIACSNAATGAKSSEPGAANRIRQLAANNIDTFVCGLEVMVDRLLDKLYDPLAHTQKDKDLLDDIRFQLREIKLPAGLLDLLLQRLGGPSVVAELTGRQRRLVATAGGMHLEERGELDGVNVIEQKAFQQGRKRVAIITEAASAGISLHSERREGFSNAPRYMLTLELPWEADKAVQQLGRVHRSNQARPPRFGVLLTELGGECRFASSVARRMRLLGAITRGDRASAADVTGGLGEFDIQNTYGKRALDKFYQILRTRENFPTQLNFVGRRRKFNDYISFYIASEQAFYSIGIRLNTDEKFDNSLKESKSLNSFLNRIMMLEPVMQNMLFDAVQSLYAHEVRVDQEAGVYDDGLEALHKSHGQNLRIELVHRETIFTDHQTGAETTYIRLKLDLGMSWESADKLAELRCEEVRGDGFYMWRRDGVDVPALAVACPSRPSDEEDEDKRRFILYTPKDGALVKLPGSANRINLDILTSTGGLRHVGATSSANLRSTWKGQFDFAGQMPVGTPESRFIEEHVLGGSILNVWGAVGSAVRGRPGGAAERLPLVRARPSNIKEAIVGVRIDPNRLQEIRYALNALHESSLTCSQDVVNDSNRKTSESTQEEFHLPAVVKVDPPTYDQVMDCMRQHLSTLEGEFDEEWNGWVQVHEFMVGNGLADNSAECVVAVQHWVGELLRLKIVEKMEPCGIRIRPQPKGCGWYVPPPKPKPLPKRGRGRGARGRGRGRG